MEHFTHVGKHVLWNICMGVSGRMMMTSTEVMSSVWDDLSFDQRTGLLSECKWLCCTNKLI